jgi:hypothetical protein
MEPPPGKPVRKRRRWLVIAIAMLALISLGTWGLWSPLDPRLMGEWQLSPDDPHSSWAAFTLEIRADGMADHVHLPAFGQGAGAMLKLAGPQPFKISGDQLEVSNDGPVGVMQVIVKLRNLIRGRRPQVFARGRIVSVDEQQLVLAFEEWGELVFLRMKDGTLEERLQSRSSGPVLASPGPSLP